MGGYFTQGKPLEFNPKRFRVVFNQNLLPSDSICDAICPMCGDGEEETIGQVCKHCGHATYEPCLEVDASWFDEWKEADREKVIGLHNGEPMSAFGTMPESISDVIRIE